LFPEVSITCSILGDGTECGIFQTTPENCMQVIEYVYTFKSIGTAPLTIIEAMSNIIGNIGGYTEPVDMIPYLVPTVLQPGQVTMTNQSLRVNYCSLDPIIVKVTSKANPGGCEDEATMVFSGRPYVNIKAS
jgi:hypothetical protein